MQNLSSTCEKHEDGIPAVQVTTTFMLSAMVLSRWTTLLQAVTIQLSQVKAGFHYSSQLQTWFLTRFAVRFSTSSGGFAARFRPAFDFFVKNLVANCSRFTGSCTC